MSLPIDVLGYFLPNALLSKIFSELLILEDICQLDSAISNKKKRPVFLECVKSEYCIWIEDTNQDFSSHGISWLKNRSIKLRHLTCGRITDDIALQRYLYIVLYNDYDFVSKSIFLEIALFIIMDYLEHRGTKTYFYSCSSFFFRFKFKLN
jgi:hypothetical protein